MIVWVTGASSGLGLHTAQAMAKAGHTVIAGARSFQEGRQNQMHCFPLDVTDDESIQRFTASALKVADHVDCVVHCAGILMLGSCEETTLEEYARVMNTDFFGMVRINQAVLPLMRAQGHGKIMMFSSINGLLGIPFQSAYTAAKHAVEGYAECLQMEVKPFGIQICLVEPGDHRSGSEAYRGHTTGMRQNSPYASFFQKGTAFVYAGQEYGRTHLPSLFDKDTVTLEPENGVDLSDDILRLCAIKKDPIFRNSVYQLSSDGDTITATHTCGDRKLTGVFSLKGDAMPVITEG